MRMQQARFAQCSDQSTEAMAEDKHFNEPTATPPLGVEDHQPTDKVAARGLAVVLGIALVLGGIITVLVYRHYAEPTAIDQQIAPAS